MDHEVDLSPSATFGALEEFSATPADPTGCHEVTSETVTGVDGASRVGSVSPGPDSSDAGSVVAADLLAWAARSIASSCWDRGVSSPPPASAPSSHADNSAITTTAAALVPAMICQRRFWVASSGCG